MTYSRKFLGKNFFNKIMKMTFYGHFVAGECKDSIKPTIENMLKYNVKSILDYSAEEDLNSSTNQVQEINEYTFFEIFLKFFYNCLFYLRPTVSAFTKHYHPSEYKLDKNMKIFLDCIEAVSVVTKGAGLAALKVTSLVRPEVLLKLSEFLAEMKNE